MIIKIDKKDKTKTTYKCDKCSKVINKENTYRIFKQEPSNKNPVKKWDLCKECYILLEKNIERSH